MNLCVVGTLAYDSIETPFGRADDALGGSASYIATAASYFVQPVGIVGVVGGDFAPEALEFLRSKGVDTTGVEIKPDGKTFRWAGRYHFDLNNRDTLDTQLNVLAEFDPVIPDPMRDARFVCLGNIDPSLQLKVLDQMRKPEFIVCDTMNFWIEGTPEKLREVLTRVDCLIINDSEARLLTGEANLVKSARMIMEMGPHILIIKKGEHGALLFLGDDIFSAPAYPLESIFDPTGAGDTFAGGFIGYLARAGEVNAETLRRAVINGSAMASFCVERFSLDALKDLTHAQIGERLTAFRRLSHYEFEEVPLGDTAS
ncbi:MAG TPA: PfkB family carbohydrate kinase [Candidatus Kapabacteria bacterium]|nr:PfkB family carbohydrate kinase [Candidatus Kapabacteria bacterium]